MSDTTPGAAYEKAKERRGYATVQAVDPHDGGLWDLLISPQLLESTKRRGMGRARELADSVRWVLLNPSGLFRGIRDIEREIDDDGWLCYAGVPPNAYDYKTGDRRDPWPSQTLIVCVNDERVLYGWWWVQSDPTNPALPVDHQVRFRTKVF